MIRTYVLPCSVPRPDADALNRESGRLYSRALVEHYRVYRQTGHWLSPSGLEKLIDFYEAQDGQPRLLHAHSMDAAEQGFPKACKTARTCKAAGLPKAHYPHKRKFWRTTIWKCTGLRLKTGVLLLARAKGLEPLALRLPSEWVGLPASAFSEVRLVWNKAGHGYAWHVVIDDGQPTAESPGAESAAGDLGEIHPITLTDGHTTTVVAARELRAVHQLTNKVLADIQHKQSAKTKNSRSWKRLQRRKARFLARQKRRARDIEHKVSRTAVNWAVEAHVGTLALGDVRDIADGKRLNAQSQQKISNWTHGQLRRFITYKAESAGITVVLASEAHTSQTCPRCGERHKPKGRRYICPACGFSSHRDAVGAINTLRVSRHCYDRVGKLLPPEETKYRHPVRRRTQRVRPDRARRSTPDTAQVAGAHPSGH